MERSAVGQNNLGFEIITSVTVSLQTSQNEQFGLARFAIKIQHGKSISKLHKVLITST